MLRERQLTDVNLEAALLRQIRRICDDEQIAWDTISQTDAAGPDGPDWGMLLALLDDAIAALLDELLDTPGILLLRGLGILARYRRLDLLARLAEGAGTRSLHGWWLLVADPGGDGRPTIDGQAIAVVSAAQWTRVPRSWARGAPQERVAA